MGVRRTASWGESVGGGIEKKKRLRRGGFLEARNGWQQKSPKQSKAAEGDYS